MAIPLVSTMTASLAGWQSSAARSIEAAGASLHEMTLRLSEQLDRLGVAARRPEPSMNEQLPVIVVSVAGVIVSGIVCLAAFAHWRRVHEARLRTLEVLAREGKLESKQIVEFLDPSKRRLKLVMILAWLTLISGIITVVASGFESGRGQEEMIAAGVGIIIAAFGVLATPIMLRELKRQGVL
jgi:hypothetical protein